MKSLLERCPHFREVSSAAFIAYPPSSPPSAALRYDHILSAGGSPQQLVEPHYSPERHEESPTHSKV